MDLNPIIEHKAQIINEFTKALEKRVHLGGQDVPASISLEVPVGDLHVDVDIKIWPHQNKK